MTDNSLDPYDNEGRWVHSEEHRKEEERLAAERRVAQATEPVGGTSAGAPSPEVPFAPKSRWANRPRMAVDMKVCISVLIVCIGVLALMAHW